MPDPDEIKRKLAELSQRIQKTQESIEKVRARIQISAPAAPKTKAKPAARKPSPKPSPKPAPKPAPKRKKG